MNERSKIIKLLINGNDQYKGKIISITKNRFVNFNVFLDQLTTYFKGVMPNGVRRVYKYGSFQFIQRLDELENYGCYICCSNERLKKMAYDSNFTERFIVNQSERKFYKRSKINNRLINGSIVPNSNVYNDIEDTKNFYREKIKDDSSPKLLKIVFNDQPHDVFKIFINRNLEISLKECLYNISINLNRKLHKHEKIKIFTVSGREITNLSELYINRSPILAFTNPIVMYPNDVKEMILSLFPDRHRAERYFSKWLIEEESGSSNSIRLQSSQTSNSNNSKEKFRQHEKYLSSNSDNVLSNREKQFINKINNRQTEIEKYENDKIKREISYSGNENFRGNNKDTTDAKQSNNNQNHLKVIHLDKYTQISPRITFSEKLTQAIPNLKYLEKATVASSRTVHLSKMTQFVHTVRHLDKFNQIQPQTKHLDKNLHILPHFVHVSSEIYGAEINQPIKKFYPILSEANLKSPKFSSAKSDRNSTISNSNYQLLSKDYNFIKILSKSNNSQVVLVENIKKEKRIIKTIQLSSDHPNRENESQILLSCDHRNVIKCFEVFRSEYYVQMVLEFMSDGNLENYLTEKEIYEEDIMKLVKCVGSGLFYLHTVGLVHRNIAPRNIYFHSNPLTFKIGDMSRAVEFSENMIYKETTLRNIYSAPELQLNEKYNEKIDIWSLGVILSNIVCRANQQEIIDTEFIMDHNNPNWNDWSPDCKLLVTEMVKEDPSTRFSALQVLCHPWLTQTQNRDVIQSQLFEEMETFNRQYIDTLII